MTLQDITKQESGIVLYGDGDMIICNLLTLTENQNTSQRV